MNEAYLVTGGNMGDRAHYLAEAKSMVQKKCGAVTKASAIFETAAWGNTNQEAFLNQCLVLCTDLPAGDLLQELLHIEQTLGRERTERYGPRTIDIDIIFFNNDIIEQQGLHVPHPKMQNRRFVLECICDISPLKMHPVWHKTVAQLLAECTDPLSVYKFP